MSVTGDVGIGPSAPRDGGPAVVQRAGDVQGVQGDAHSLERPGASGPRGRRWVMQGLVLVAPALVLAVMGWAKRNMYDDGFIYLRIVQNLLGGDGPVFNVGDRVEAYTSTLWVGVVSLVGWVTPFPLEWVAVVLGLAMAVGAVLVAVFAGRRLALTAQPGAFLLPLGVLVFVVVPVVWTYATTGLETGLSFLWLALCLAALVRWAVPGDTAMSWPWLVIVGLGPLIRPEMLLVSALVVVGVTVLQWRSSTPLGRARVPLVAAAVPVAYEIFRMAYFGLIVPNTALAKEGTSLRPGLGWAYSWDFVGTYLLIIPLAALLVGAYVPLALALRRGQPRGRAGRRLFALLALPVAGITQAVYFTLIGGDYLHGRLLLPAFFAILAPVAVVPLRPAYAISLVVLPWAVVCALVLRTELTVPLPIGHIRSDGMVTPEQSGWPVTDLGPDDSGLYAKVGLRITPVIPLDVPLAPGVTNPTLAASGIGLQSYVGGTGVAIYDMLGLASALPAHLQLTERGLPGHEKLVPVAWMAAQLSAPGSSPAPFERLQAMRNRASGKGESSESLAEPIAWARAALKCPVPADILDSTSAPLTPLRAWQNFAGAAGRSQVRIPADPQEAYRQLCGPGIPSEVAAVRAQSAGESAPTAETGAPAETSAQQ